MDLFPNEIIGKIVNYTGIIVYRHGVYINRLNKSDSRYQMIAESLSKAEIKGNGKLIAKLRSNTMLLTVHTYLNGDGVRQFEFKIQFTRHPSVTALISHTYGFEMPFYKSSTYYLSFNGWYRILHYSM